MRVAWLQYQFMVGLASRLGNYRDLSQYLGSGTNLCYSTQCHMGAFFEEFLWFPNLFVSNRSWIVV